MKSRKETSYIFLLLTLEALSFTSPLLHILPPPLLIHHHTIIRIFTITIVISVQLGRFRKTSGTIPRSNYYCPTWPSQLGSEIPFPGAQNRKETGRGLESQKEPCPLLFVWKWWWRGDEEGFSEFWFLLSVFFVPCPFLFDWKWWWWGDEEGLKPKLFQIPPKVLLARVTCWINPEWQTYHQKLHMLQILPYIHSKSVENRFWPLFASPFESWMSFGLTRASGVDMGSVWSLVKPWTASGMESMVEAMRANTMVLALMQSRLTIFLPLPTIINWPSSLPLSHT